MNQGIPVEKGAGLEYHFVGSVISEENITRNWFAFSQLWSVSGELVETSYLDS